MGPIRAFDTNSWTCATMLQFFEALAARIEKVDVVIHCTGRVVPWEVQAGSIQGHSGDSFGRQSATR
jgi:hypothetical protein